MSRLAAGSIEAVLFDIDDTLVDFAASAAAGIAAVLPAGTVGPAGIAEHWSRATERQYPRFLTGELGFLQMQLARLAELLEVTGQRALDAADLLALEHRRQAAMNGHYRLFADVLPCLAALGTFRLGVVSNSDGPHQRAKLASVGLDAAFEVVVISGDLGVAKPDPTIFREACRLLGLPPSAVAYVGDRWETDAVAAADAGLAAFWLDRSDGAHAPGNDSRVTVITGLDQLADTFTALSPADSALRGAER